MKILLLCALIGAVVAVTDRMEGEIPGISDWVLVWEEEFEGRDLRHRWNFETGCKGWGNGEVECYTDNQEVNAHQKSSTLLITAAKQLVSVEDDKDARFYNNTGFVVTSARLATKDAWLYGKFEMSARLPRGRYLWPAFWMMPATSHPYGKWPRSGEIDIMEYRGSRPHEVCGTLHFGESSLGSQHKVWGSGDTKFPFDFSSEWHQFSLLWNSTGMWWAVDEVVYHHQDLRMNMYPGFYKEEGEPFTSKPFYILINLAVAGNFFETDEPFRMSDVEYWTKPTYEIDWIRVWQKNG